MAKKRGQPTLYSKEVLGWAREYIDEAQDENLQLVRQANSEKGYEMYENKLKVNLPTIEGLALHLNVNRDTLYEWEKIHKEFSDILAHLRAEQAKRLIDNGLSGDYNPVIAKLLLMKHGYAEKTETDLTSKGEKLAPAVQITGMQIIKDEPNADTVQNKKRKADRSS